MTLSAADTVVLVDHEPNARELMRLWIGLADLGEPTCVELDDGAGLLEYLATGARPTVVFLKCGPSGGFGWPALGRVRSDPVHDGTAVIVTGISGEPQLAYGLGADGFFDLISDMTAWPELARQVVSLDERTLRVVRHRRQLEALRSELTALAAAWTGADADVGGDAVCASEIAPMSPSDDEERRELLALCVACIDGDANAALAVAGRGGEAVRTMAVGAAVALGAPLDGELLAWVATTLERNEAGLGLLALLHSESDSSDTPSAAYQHYARADPAAPWRMGRALWRLSKYLGSQAAVSEARRVAVWLLSTPASPEGVPTGGFRPAGSPELILELRHRFDFTGMESFVADHLYEFGSSGSGPVHERHAALLHAFAMDERCGSEIHAAWCLVDLGIVEACELGQLSGGRQRFREALSRFEDRDEYRGIVVASSKLANALSVAGHCDEAIAVLEGLRKIPPSIEPLLAGGLHGTRADLYERTGDVSGALAEYALARDQYARGDLPTEEFAARVDLARVQLGQGRLDAAAEALPEDTADGRDADIGKWFRVNAALAAARGDLESAQRLYRSVIDDPRTPYDAVYATTSLAKLIAKEHQDEAVSLCASALALARQMDTPVVTSWVAMRVATSLDGLGRSGEALAAACTALDEAHRADICPVRAMRLAAELADRLGRASDASDYVRSLLDLVEGGSQNREAALRALAALTALNIDEFTAERVAAHIGHRAGIAR